MDLKEETRFHLEELRRKSIYRGIKQGDHIIQKKKKAKKHVLWFGVIQEKCENHRR